MQGFFTRSFATGYKDIPGLRRRQTEARWQLCRQKSSQNGAQTHRCGAGCISACLQRDFLRKTLHTGVFGCIWPTLLAPMLSNDGGNISQSKATVKWKVVCATGGFFFVGVEGWGVRTFVDISAVATFVCSSQKNCKLCLLSSK